MTTLPRGLFSFTHESLPWAKVRKKIERTVENPVEVEAYNATVIADLLIGLPFDLMTTDARKSELLIARVLQRRAEGARLTVDDYQGIMHPPLEIAGPVGRRFEQGLNRIGSWVMKPVRAVGLARSPLDQRIDFEAAVQWPVDEAAASPGSAAAPDPQAQASGAMTREDTV